MKNLSEKVQDSTHELAYTLELTFPLEKQRHWQTNILSQKHHHGY